MEWDDDRLNRIRAWNETLKHDTTEPYRKLTRAHLVIEDLLNEIAALSPAPTDGEVERLQDAIRQARLSLPMWQASVAIERAKRILDEALAATRAPAGREGE